MIDLTPAAIGPFCVPPVNLADAVAQKAMNVNMVTCGGQATIPLVAAVSRVQAVSYGEIVATVSSPNLPDQAHARTSMSLLAPPPAASSKWVALPVARPLSLSTRRSRR